MLRLGLLLATVGVVCSISSPPSLNSVSCTTSPLEVVLLFDVSPAPETVFEHRKRRVVNIVRHIEQSTRGRSKKYSLVSFYQKPINLVELGSPLSGRVEKLISRLALLHQSTIQSNSSSVARAIESAAAQFSQDGVDGAIRLVFLIHDGANTDLVAETLEAVSALEKQGATLFAVSAGEQPQVYALQGYAGERSRVLAVDADTIVFTAAIDEVTGSCSEQSSNVPNSSELLAKARERQAKSFGFRVRDEGKRKSHKFDPNMPCNDEKVDLMLLIDSSGSVFNAFKEEVQYAIDLLQAIPEQAYIQNLQVSLVRFAADSQLLLPFKIGRSKEEIIETVRNIPFTGRSTRIAEAVEIGVSELEQHQRADARQIFLLISDGHGQEYWSVVQATGRKLQEADFEVFSVTHSRDFSFPELMLYAGDPDRIFVGARSREFIPTVSTLIRKCLANSGKLQIDDGLNKNVPKTVIVEEPVTLAAVEGSGEEQGESTTATTAEEVEVVPAKNAEESSTTVKVAQPETASSEPKKSSAAESSTEEEGSESGSNQSETSKASDEEETATSTTKATVNVVEVTQQPSNQIQPEDIKKLARVADHSQQSSEASVEQTTATLAPENASTGDESQSTTESVPVEITSEKEKEKEITAEEQKVVVEVVTAKPREPTTIKTIEAFAPESESVKATTPESASDLDTGKKEANVTDEKFPVPVVSKEISEAVEDDVAEVTTSKSSVEVENNSDVEDIGAPTTAHPESGEEKPEKEEKIEGNPVARTAAVDTFKNVIDIEGSGADEDHSSGSEEIDCDVDMVLVVDRSQSVEDDYQKELRTAVDTVNMGSEKDYKTGRIRVGAVSFARDGQVELPLEARSRSEVVDVVSKIRHTGGTTSAVSGFQSALRVRDRKSDGKRRCRPRLSVSSSKSSHDSETHVAQSLSNPIAGSLHAKSHNLHEVSNSSDNPSFLSNNPNAIPHSVSPDHNQDISSLLVDVIDIAFSSSTQASITSKHPTNPTIVNSRSISSPAKNKLFNSDFENLSVEEFPKPSSDKVPSHAVIAPPTSIPASPGLRYNWPESPRTTHPPVIVYIPRTKEEKWVVFPLQKANKAPQDVPDPHSYFKSARISASSSESTSLTTDGTLATTQPTDATEHYETTSVATNGAKEDLISTTTSESIETSESPEETSPAYHSTNGNFLKDKTRIKSVTNNEKNSVATDQEKSTMWMSNEFSDGMSDLTDDSKELTVTPTDVPSTTKSIEFGSIEVRPRVETETTSTQSHPPANESAKQPILSSETVTSSSDTNNTTSSGNSHSVSEIDDNERRSSAFALALSQMLNEAITQTPASEAQDVSRRPPDVIPSAEVSEAAENGDDPFSMEKPEATENLQQEITKLTSEEHPSFTEGPSTSASQEFTGTMEPTGFNRHSTEKRHSSEMTPASVEDPMAMEIEEFIPPIEKKIYMEPPRFVDESQFAEQEAGSGEQQVTDEGRGSDVQQLEMESSGEVVDTTTPEQKVQENDETTANREELLLVSTENSIEKEDQKEGIMEHSGDDSSVEGPVIDTSEPERIEATSPVNSVTLENSPVTEVQAPNANLSMIEPVVEVIDRVVKTLGEDPLMHTPEPMMNRLQGSKTFDPLGEEVKQTEPAFEKVSTENMLIQSNIDTTLASIIAKTAAMLPRKHRLPLPLNNARVSTGLTKDHQNQWIKTGSDGSTKLIDHETNNVQQTIISDTFAPNQAPISEDFGIFSPYSTDSSEYVDSTPTTDSEHMSQGAAMPASSTMVEKITNRSSSVSSAAQIPTNAAKSFSHHSDDDEEDDESDYETLVGGADPRFIGQPNLFEMRTFTPNPIDYDIPEGTVPVPQRVFLPGVPSELPVFTDEDKTVPPPPPQPSLQPIREGLANMPATTIKSTETTEPRKVQYPPLHVGVPGAIFDPYTGHRWRYVAMGFPSPDAGHGTSVTEGKLGLQGSEQELITQSKTVSDFMMAPRQEHTAAHTIDNTMTSSIDMTPAPMKTFSLEQALWPFEGDVSVPTSTEYYDEETAPSATPRPKARAAPNRGNRLRHLYSDPVMFATLS